MLCPKSMPIFSESAKPYLINLRYNTSKKIISCIKDDRKLIKNEIKGTMELYDLDKDFEEKRNCFESERKIANKMIFLIERHLLLNSFSHVEVK